MDKSIKSQGFGDGCPRAKLQALNWLEGVSGNDDCNIVEVAFKNTRTGYYVNAEPLDLHIGDMVVVESSPGYDIGRVNMTGRLVRLQMRKAQLKDDQDLKKVLRFATKTEMERAEEAHDREHDTMIRARKIAEDLSLDMKIGDVEYQADGVKAIFYYIADERVDFRTLIRVLAETFKVRVEMRQIGARQEAGRIGGIGPCGRPLCCSQWMTKFNSVGTGAARIQDLSMSPQKLAGQCAKLKCCINFETAVYAEAQKQIPGKDIQLERAPEGIKMILSDWNENSQKASTRGGNDNNAITQAIDDDVKDVKYSVLKEEDLSYAAILRNVAASAVRNTFIGDILSFLGAKAIPTRASTRWVSPSPSQHVSCGLSGIFSNGRKNPTTSCSCPTSPSWVNMSAPAMAAA